MSDHIFDKNRLDELEKACLIATPGTCFVAKTKDGTTRVSREEMLELIRCYRGLCWTKGV